MLLNENSLIETMFDVMPFGVYVVDVKTMEIIHMNRVMISLRGKNLTGRTCYRALYENDTPCIFCRMDDVLSPDQRPNGHSVTYDHFDDIKDGWFQIQSKAITWPDGRVVMCVIAVDISELKETQNHLAEAHAELALKNRDLERLSLQKSEFFATISHEIRTPLSAVIGLSELALKTQLTLKQRDYLKKIHTASNGLLRILNDTLDYSKVEAGKISLELIPFELPQMLDEVVSIFYPDASRKSIELLLSLDDKVPWFVVGDPFRLGQILSNLLSNAVKFTTSGHIITKVALIKRTGEQVTLRFSVSDTGIGISEKMLPRLFTVFTQESTATTRKYGGTGLGLAICKKMAELMNGTIWVESQKRQGTTVTFQVDLSLQSREQHRQCSIPMPTHPLHILIADDNPVSLGLLEKMLQNFGCRVTSVDSGEAVLERLETERDNAPPFDLLITDWHMKKINGIQLAKIIKKDSHFGELPIMLISAFDTDGELMAQSSNVGIHTFIPKPINPSTLFDSIMDLFCRDVRLRTPLSEQACLEASSRNLLSGKEILLVDDNSINRQVGSELLGHLGAVVQTAASGSQAIEMALNTPFDLILMDVSMPKMNGYEATRQLRQYIPHTPIIAMTAHSSPADRKKALAAGMTDFLSKPINPAVVAHVLSQVLITDPQDVDMDGNRDRDLDEPHGKNALASHADGSSAAHDAVVGPISETTAVDHSDPLLNYFAKQGGDTPLDPPDGTSVLLSEALGKSGGAVLDAERAINRLGGNRVLYCDLLQQFLRESVSRIDAVKQALWASDMARAAEMVHFIRGSAGNVGLIRLHRIAGLFEPFLVTWPNTNSHPSPLVMDEERGETVKKGDAPAHGKEGTEIPQQIWQGYQRFAWEMDEAAQAVTVWLDANGVEMEDETSAEPLPKAATDMETTFRTLAELLTSHNALAMNYMDQLMAWPTVAERDDANEMADKVAALKFDAALELLHSIAADHAIDL